jgi:hypothetical protein
MSPVDEAAAAASEKEGQASNQAAKPVHASASHCGGNENPRVAP